MSTEKKPNDRTAIITALIVLAGTIIAAIFTSPWIIEYIKEPPPPKPSPTATSSPNKFGKPSIAGDPPKFEPVARTIQETISTEINNLKLSHILFNPSQEMKVGETETVEVRIAKSFVGDLAKGLKGKGTPQIENIRVSSYMGVVLNGTEGFFSITLKNREQKIIADNEYTEWIFDVTPLKPGNPSLYLTAYNVIDTPVGERTYEHPAFSKEIKVTTTATYTIVTFLKNNWKEIIGLVIASGIVGFIVNGVKRKRQKKEPPSWERP